LEREQTRRRKITRKEERGAFTTKVKYRGTMATTTLAPSLAKETGKFSTASANRACSNRKS